MAFAGPSAAQPVLCDPALKQVTDTPLGYRQRGERCEGLYVKEVGATLLRVVGLTESFDDYDPASAKPLQLEWTAWDGAAKPSLVRLRAEALLRRSYYRMDTQRPAEAGRFTWPGDVLASQRFQRQDLGLLAMSSGPVGDTVRTVYLPLRASQQSRPPRAAAYKLVLMPGVDLEEIFLSLGPAGPSGWPQSWLMDNQPQRLGYYPAERAIVILLPVSGPAGLYCAQLGARLRGGGSATVELWFHHDGHQPG